MLFGCVRGHERSASHLVNRVSPHSPLVPSTLARARRAYPSQARLGYAGAERSASHLVLIRLRPATRLMISSCRFVTALADHSRPSLSTALLSGWSPHLVNRVSPHTPLVPSTLARARRAYPSQARLGYEGAERSASHLVIIMFQFAFPLSQARTP